MKKKGFSIILTLAAAFVLMIPSFFAGTVSAFAADRAIYTKSDAQGYGDGSEGAPYKNFADALDAAQDGDTIVIDEKAFLNDDQGKPLVIDKKITIKSKQAGELAVLNTRRSGIVLHADTVFEDINIAEASGQYPGIYANGNNLTLKNVKSDSSAVQIHVFAGGLKIGSSYHGGKAPEAKGNVIRIEGPNAFGGKLFLAGENVGQDVNNDVSLYMKNLSIYQVKAVYGHGAESPAFNTNDWFSNLGNIPEPVPSAAYAVKGKVAVNLEDVSSPSVDLEHVEGDTEINYTSNGAYLESGSFKGTDTFNLLKGSLKPSELSCGIDGRLNLKIQEGARFDFTGTDVTENNKLEVDRFAGGGTLVLPKEPGSRFTISSGIDGEKTTTIEIANSNEGIALENEIRYVETTVADNVAESAFKFPANYGDRTLVKDNNGWRTNKLFKIFYESENPEMGTVSEDITSFQEGNEPGAVTAIPNKGYKFLYWAIVDDDYKPLKKVSEDATFSPMPNAEGSYEELYVAFFEKEENPLSIEAEKENIKVIPGTPLEEAVKKPN